MDDKNTMATETDEVIEQRRKLKEEFISNVTLHGYRYLFVSSKGRKITWYACFLSAVLLAVFLFYGVVSDYYMYKFITVIQVDYDAESIEFPTLTICRRGPLTKLKLSQFPLHIPSGDFNRLYANLIKPSSNKIKKTTKKYIKMLEAKNITTYQQLMSLFEMDNYNLFNDTNATGVFGACIFGGKQCGIKDMKNTYNWHRKYCQQFNSYTPKKTTKVQSTAKGFQATLNLQGSEELVTKSSFEAQPVLFIHPYGTPHYIDVLMDKVDLQPGKKTTIYIDQSKVKEPHYIVLICIVI